MPIAACSVTGHIDSHCRGTKKGYIKVACGQRCFLSCSVLPLNTGLIVKTGILKDCSRPHAI